MPTAVIVLSPSTHPMMLDLPCIRSFWCSHLQMSAGVQSCRPCVYIFLHQHMSWQEVTCSTLLCSLCSRLMHPHQIPHYFCEREECPSKFSRAISAEPAPAEMGS